MSGDHQEASGKAAGNTQKSYGDPRPFPLVDFISRWRQRGRSGGGGESDSGQAVHLEAGESPGGRIYHQRRHKQQRRRRTASYDDEDLPDSPLLVNRHSSSGEQPSPTSIEDAAYPYPSTFLPNPLTHQESRSMGGANSSDDNDDNQSIRSYDGEKIDHYDRRKDLKKPKLFLQDSSSQRESDQNPFPLLSICATGQLEEPVPTPFGNGAFKKLTKKNQMEMIRYRESVCVNGHVIRIRKMLF